MCVSKSTSGLGKVAPIAKPGQCRREHLVPRGAQQRRDPVPTPATAPAARDQDHGWPSRSSSMRAVTYGAPRSSRDDTPRRATNSGSGRRVRDGAERSQRLLPSDEVRVADAPSATVTAHRGQPLHGEVCRSMLGRSRSAYSSRVQSWTNERLSLVSECR